MVAMRIHPSSVQGGTGRHCNLPRIQSGSCKDLRRSPVSPRQARTHRSQIPAGRVPVAPDLSVDMLPADVVALQKISSIYLIGEKHEHRVAVLGQVFLDARAEPEATLYAHLFPFRVSHTKRKDLTEP